MKQTKFVLEEALKRRRMFLSGNPFLKGKEMEMKGLFLLAALLSILLEPVSFVFGAGGEKPSPPILPDYPQSLNDNFTLSDIYMSANAYNRDSGEANFSVDLRLENHRLERAGWDIYPITWEESPSDWRASFRASGFLLKDPENLFNGFYPMGSESYIRTSELDIDSHVNVFRNDQEWQETSSIGVNGNMGIKSSAVTSTDFYYDEFPDWGDSDLIRWSFRYAVEGKFLPSEENPEPEPWVGMGETLALASVPEPSSAFLLLSGIASGFGFLFRFRRR